MNRFAFWPSIIVIGPDRVGKTTIVKLLSEMIEIPSFKCPAEKQIFKQGGRSSLAFDYTLTHFVSQVGCKFISDRGYPCEWVYSKVFSRDTDVPLLEMIDVAHTNIGTIILYLYSSEEPTEEDDLVPADKYWDVKETYDDFCEWTSCKVVAYDTAKMLQTYRDGGDSSKEHAERILQLIEKVKDAKWIAG